VSRSGAKSLALVSAEILAEVEAEERIKVAEIATIRDSAPHLKSEIAELLRKVAQELRAPADEVTYDDLERFVAGVA
jgi:hypothetical protein